VRASPARLLTMVAMSKLRVRTKTGTRRSGSRKQIRDHSIEHATDQQLKQAFQSHLQETEAHVNRLSEIIGDSNNGDVDDKKDAIITALIASGENIVKESDAGPVRDAALLATAQKVEHYEIASYGAARDWAKLLGLSTHAEILQKTLDEEKHADELLSTISARANYTAAAA
jgi:ferritin-like metal-binding protein YciE